jgi:hypothetical protein
MTVADFMGTGGFLIEYKKKIKQSRYRLGVAQRFPGS